LFPELTPEEGEMVQTEADEDESTNPVNVHVRAEVVVPIARENPRVFFFSS
jgi:hypothetical protein